jgi:hypothetical protein
VLDEAGDKGGYSMEVPAPVLGLGMCHQRRSNGVSAVSNGPSDRPDCISCSFPLHPLVREGPLDGWCRVNVLPLQAPPLLLPPFQGHLLRRLPTASELSGRGSCALTQRDLEIFMAIELHGFLTASLISLAFFTPTAGARRRPASRAFGRLRLLWLWGYLDRYLLPAPRGMLGSVPCVYALGQPALQYLPPSIQGKRSDPRSLEQLDPRFVQHELAAAAFWAHLQAEVGAGRLAACRWTPERELRAQRRRVQDPRTRRWLPVLLDGFVELEDDDGRIGCAMVEIDRGTLTVERFQRKLRAWEAYVGSGRFREDWGHADACLVVLVESWDRLRGIWKAGRRQVPEGRWARYVFSTLDVLTPDRFGRADVWLSMRGEYARLLDSLFSAARTGAQLSGN